MDKSKELPILLKVVEEKYLQSTLSGNIFFGSLDLYKSAENQQGDKVIGDANEGKLKNEINVANIWLEIQVLKSYWEVDVRWMVTMIWVK